MSLRVLHVVRSPLTVQAFLLPIFAEHRRRGHTVHVALSPDQGAVPDDTWQATVRPYPLARSLSPMGLVRAIAALRDILHSGRYDVVMAHMVLPGAVTRWAYAQAGCPGRLVYASHGLPCYPTAPRWQRWVADGLERWLGRCQAGIIVLNDHDEAWARRRRVGRVYRLATVGIDVQDLRRRAGASDRAALGRRFGLEPGRPWVCAVARLIRAKGIDCFLETAAELRRRGVDAQFVVAGDGPLRPALERRGRELGLAERLHWVGWLDDPIGLVAGSDILCLPTRYEGAPVIVQEAMACGTLVVSSDVPGPRDLIEHERTGWLCPVDDVSAFADAVQRGLEDHAARAALVQAATEAAEAWDVRTWAPRWVDVVEEVAGGR